MPRMVRLLLAGLLLMGLASCGQPGGKEDSFTVNVVCESEGLAQIFYSCYVDGEYRGMGGIADLDGAEAIAVEHLAEAIQYRESVRFRR